MRVLLITPKFFTATIGGVPTVVRELARGLKAQGHQVLVVTDLEGGYPKEGWHQGIEYLQLPLRYRQVLPLLFALPGLNKRFRPELVNVHYPVGGQAMLGFFFSLFYRVPLVASLHYREPWHPDFLYRWACGLVCRRAERVTACSGYLAGRSSQALGREVATIYNGAGAAPDQAQAGMAEIERPAEPGELFSCAGRFSKEKNFSVAIEAFSRLAAGHPGARLSLAGSGPLEQELKRQAQNTAPPGTVEFLGQLPPDGVMSMFSRSLAVVVPTIEEAFGLVVLEAMAAGAVVIGAGSGGIPELIVDSESGLLFDPESPESLEAKMRWVLANQKNLEQIRARGRAAARSFSWERMAEGYQKIYAEAAG